VLGDLYEEICPLSVCNRTNRCGRVVSREVLGDLRHPARAVDTSAAPEPGTRGHD